MDMSQACLERSKRQKCTCTGSERQPWDEFSFALA
jgi:hypothetical protein